MLINVPSDAPSRRRQGRARPGLSEGFGWLGRDFLFPLISRTAAGSHANSHYENGAGATTTGGGLYDGP